MRLNYFSVFSQNMMTVSNLLHDAIDTKLVVVGDIIVH